MGIHDFVLKGWIEGKAKFANPKKIGQLLISLVSVTYSLIQYQV